jgi:hypothetical protein
MRISPEKLAAEAETTGFRPEVLEKVAHLLGLLDAIRSHPFLQGKLVLKGGTALNLFIFDVPRLVEESRKALSAVLPFTENELTFLDLLLEKGEIDSSLLTADAALRQRIQRQPLLEWKALNVRKHRGLA